MTQPLPRILLADELDAAAEARLAARAQIVRPAAAGEAALISAIPGCVGLVARTHTRVTRRLLDAGRELRVVGVAGVGVENVDEQAARERGILIVNTPAAASDAVAELAVALMLQLLRPIPRLADEYRRGRYRAARAQAHGVELKTLTVGIIGMGRIGGRVGRICADGFGCRVLYNDIVEIAPLPYPALQCEKEEIWSTADIISLHVPATPQTHGLVNNAILSRCRHGLRVINTSRGSVVDTEALTQALRDEELAGAALDVTDPEPLPSNHALFEMPNVILTPHIAARTEGGMQRMYAVVDEVLRALETPR